MHLWFSILTTTILFKHIYVTIIIVNFLFSLTGGHWFRTTSKKQHVSGGTWLLITCWKTALNVRSGFLSTDNYNRCGREEKQRHVSGQNQSSVWSVGLQWAKVTPGFLRHDSLVFSLPTNDSLPFLWHLQRKISQTQRKVGHLNVLNNVS